MPRQASEDARSDSPLLEPAAEIPAPGKDTANPHALADAACVHQLFEAQAVRTPEAVAVVFEDEEIGYAELNRRANRLARRLRQLAVGPDVLVGICLERSVELVVGLLGILKAGGAYVPLDPGYPPERLAYMIEDSKLEVLLTQQSLIEILPRTATTLCLDSAQEALAHGPSTDLPPSSHPDNLAYVIYTSGSTGRPKGAMITHGSIVNRLLWMQEAYRLDESDGVLQKTPASFDVSVWEFFWPLLAGSRLVVARPGSHSDAAYLVDVVQRRAITTLHFVPSMLRPFLEHPGVSACRSLRRVMASGEALPAELQDRFLERLDAELHNLYGPTEAAVDVTSWHCRRGEKRAGVPIGRPIANARIHILDPGLRPVPVGVLGELHIGGRPVGRGYWGRPDLTADSFVPDPFGEEPGARLYKTGDLARYAPDGAIEYLGRLDHQIKLRGFRVELGEIEAVLGEHPRVAQSVVTAREFEGGDSRLVAYVVTANGALVAGELREFLRLKLPEHMVPSHVVLLDALPLTPSGKLDRQALPAPPESHDATRGYVAPQTPVEQALSGIWSEVLGVERVGVHDDFFELGGHSLLVLKVLSRVRERFGLELPQSALFEAPTLARLGARIQAGAGGETAWPPLTPAPRDGHLPLSFPQEQAWFMQQLEPGNLAYQSQTVLRLEGPLDVPALERALAEIVRRHEILRSTFPVVHGRPVQLTHEPWTVSLPVDDLRSLAEQAREAEAQRLVDSLVRRQFELDRLPLIRWTLLKLADQRYWLVHVEHHLLHDGWSFTIFLRELAELYRAFGAGRSSPLPEPALQFADFAAWQRRALRGPQGDAQRAYWTRKLAGAPPLLDLPGDRPRPRQQSFRGAAPRFELPPELLDGLKRLSRREGATLFMTMLAAFLVLLRRYTRQDDLCVGSGLANRRWRETETLLGMIVNTVALRVDVSGDPSFGELLRRVRETTLEAYAHQDLPFGSVVEALNPDRSLSHPPVYQVLFSFHDSPVGRLDLGGLTLTALEAVSNGSAKFDMNVIVVPRSERLTGEAPGARHGVTLIWEYSTDLFDESTVTRMAGHYQTLLRGVLADPGRRISELPLLAGHEHHRVVRDFNDTSRPFPTDRCIHELFEEQVSRAPDRVALAFGRERVSYGALNAQANRLARRLRRLGVGPEVRVGVCAERSPKAIAALLSVLKAGGVYVPLDPTHPRARQRFLLEDADIRVLLSDGHAPLDLSPGCVELRLDGDEAGPVEPAQDDLPRVAEPDNLAYVMYTSGSTGRPKGVMVPHRGVVRLVNSVDYARLAADEVLLQFAPLSFDAATFEIWGGLLNGGRLAIMPAGAASLDELAEVIRSHGVTTLWLTSGLFHELVETRPAALSGVRQILAGGDVLSAAHVQKALDALPGVRVINGYGPTESTTFAACHPMSSGGRVEPSVPIGRPIANTLAYVLDERMLPVPIGVGGELYLGGPGLARGYLGRPDLTAERFVPDPFGEQGSRLYRTGDLARHLPDGRLAFLGRLDQQVKIRGFRIEPGEIESVLEQHPDVANAAVIARPDRSGEKRLLAYVVPGGAQAITPALLQAWLRERLPEYMLPAHCVLLDGLPLTQNGKLDRGALPEPEGSLSEPALGPVPPRTPTEEVVREIFAAVLGRARIGVEQGFFELGGHSLKATRLIARVNDAFGLALPLRVLFETPTVAGVAAQVEAARSRGGGQGAAARPILPSRRRRRVETPMSRDQGPSKGGR